MDLLHYSLIYLAYLVVFGAISTKLQDKKEKMPLVLYKSIFTIFAIPLIPVLLIWLLFSISFSFWNEKKKK